MSPKTENVNWLNNKACLLDRCMMNLVLCKGRTMIKVIGGVGKIQKKKFMQSKMPEKKFLQTETEEKIFL